MEEGLRERRMYGLSMTIAQERLRDAEQAARAAQRYSRSEEELAAAKGLATWLAQGICYAWLDLEAVCQASQPGV